jgi:ATP-binding cassette subfamily F protein uup
MPPLLTLRAISLAYGATPLLDAADLSVAPGERICLVGRNGSGKSSLLKLAAGLIAPDAGERYVHPAARVTYLAQEVNFSGAKTAHDYVIALADPADTDNVVAQLLDALGLDPDLETASASGGEARRIALAAALAAKPDLLLLDEPTNHLDLPAIEWLENQLRRYSGALIFVSHDRRFLERLSTATVWLDRGRLRRLDENFAAFEAWRDQVLDEEEVERHKLARKIVREEHWMHGGVTARRKRNVRRVRELAVLRSQLRNAASRPDDARMAVAAAVGAGKRVIDAEGLHIEIDGRTLVTALDLRITRGERIGLVGANGTGKTTLLQCLIGSRSPDRGRMTLGTGLEIAYIAQRRDELDPSTTVADALTGGRGDHVVVNGSARHVASYLKDFLFKPEQTRTPLGVLSGGERARLMLARAFTQASNLLVLDEPTNDLDLETLDVLQELVAGYDGTVLLVSHDRDFLDRTVTRIVAAEGAGRWVVYAGGYSDMMAQRDAAAPASVRKAPTPAATEVKSARTTETAPRPGKLSFKDKHALETLPGIIDALTGELARLDAELADPQLYVRDRARFDAVTARITAARAELAAVEDRWLLLEMQRTDGT